MLHAPKQKNTMKYESSNYHSHFVALGRPEYESINYHSLEASVSGVRVDHYLSFALRRLDGWRLEGACLDSLVDRSHGRNPTAREVRGKAKV